MRETRTLNEIVMRYVVEPDLCDIYVEGPGDASLIDWFLKSQERSGYKVYEVETIDFDIDLLRKLGLEDNARGHVEAIALTLEQELGRELKVLCLADNDDEEFVGGTRTGCYLLRPDYCSMEMYLFNSDVLGKFFQLALRHFECDSTQVEATLGLVLMDLFAIRAANRVLGWGLTWISPDRCCRVNGCDIVFDVDDLINRYLNAGARLSDMAQFREAFDGIRGRIRGRDPRSCIRGHDFIELLAWYSGKFDNSGSIKNAHALGRFLWLSLDPGELAVQPFFRRLVERVP